MLIASSLYNTISNYCNNTEFTVLNPCYNDFELPIDNNLKNTNGVISLVLQDLFIKTINMLITVKNYFIKYQNIKSIHLEVALVYNYLYKKLRNYWKI